MIIQSGKKLLIIRYSDFLHANCIDDHINVIKTNGYCWFGKIGKQKPSLLFCNKVLKEEQPMIILHSSKKTYLCDVTEIVYERPSDGVFPQYYFELLFGKSNEPTAYFRIISCVEIEKSILYNFIVSSSKNPLPDALRSSMNSLFLAECTKTVEIKEK